MRVEEDQADNGSWWRMRLADTWSGSLVMNSDEMKWFADNNRLGLCNFTYDFVNHTTSDSNGQLDWAASSSDDCDWLLTLDSSPAMVIVHGYVSPIIVLLTLVTNSLVCAVLMQRHMRTPTNVFLLALAISDALTGAVTLPVHVYFYTLGAYHSMLIPQSWCHAYLTVSLHLPTTWHTASIWLTVGLAFQRYVYVCHQTVAKQLCTVRNAVVAVGIIYVTAILSQFLRNFDYRYESVTLSVPLGAIDNQDSATERIDIAGCLQVPLLARYGDVYLSTYWYFRILFIHLMPCVLLVGLNARLFVAMRRAQVRRSRLLSQNRHRECRRLAETNMATLMLLVVVCVFLLVELPLAVIMMTMIVENTFDPLLLMDPSVRRTATLVINLIIVFSYPVNFFIYCGMSQQFRQTFCGLFVCCIGGVGHESSKPMDSVDDDADHAEAAGRSGAREAITSVSDVHQANAVVLPLNRKIP